jgi:type II secretory pathway component GspD/PulD (secretin)
MSSRTAIILVLTWASAPFALSDPVSKGIAIPGEPPPWWFVSKPYRLGTAVASPFAIRALEPSPPMAAAGPWMPSPDVGQQGGGEPQPPRITNVFIDTDIRQALADISAAAGVVIVPDDTVSGVVNADLKEVPLERALDIVLAAGNYSWVKAEGYYLVGRATPTNPNFLRLSETRLYKPSYVAAEQIVAMLPEQMSEFLKAGPEAITIVAPRNLIPRIMADIATIDVPPRRIILEALVTEVATETLNQFNFSWVWRNFGVTSNGDGMQMRYSSVTSDDVATMKLLVTKGLATVRANPRVMTIEGKEALIEVAQENWFQVVTGPANFPYVTLQVIKSGISLKVTPSISADGMVTVQLVPEVSDATGTGQAGLPINTVRRANTTVRVRDGETIIIGGMTFESSRNRVQKVPLLSDIPLIGQLFTSQQLEKRNSEVVIMITPRIVPDGAPTR